MQTTKELHSRIAVNGCDLFIVPEGFEFVNQSCVKFYGLRLSKRQLISCCQHFLSELETLSYSDRIKNGFVLDKFMYFELSVYLHGLMSLYCSLIEIPCPPCFGLERFSHLPHDVMKPEKVTKHIEVSYLVDGSTGYHFYCCVIAGVPLCHSTFQGLQDRISHVFSGFVKKYNIILDIR